MLVGSQAIRGMLWRQRCGRGHPKVYQSVFLSHTPTSSFPYKSNLIVSNILNYPCRFSFPGNRENRVALYRRCNMLCLATDSCKTIVIQSIYLLRSLTLFVVLSRIPRSSTSRLTFSAKFRFNAPLMHSRLATREWSRIGKTQPKRISYLGINPTCRQSQF
jgi:hypothetical protein